MDKRRVTNKDRKIALVWDWLRKVNAPDQVKAAFRSLVIEQLTLGTKDNLKLWQPEFGRDEYLED